MVGELRSDLEVPGGSPNAYAAKSARLPRICNLSHLRNPNFTGRNDLLKQLHDSLTSGNAVGHTQAMHGLGGVGKTQAAVEYIYRHASEYELAWWMRSEERARLTSDYTALADPLGLRCDAAQDQGFIVQEIRQLLARMGGWLLVFDNASGPDEIRDFLPAGCMGHVLITSRNPAFGGLAHPLKVEKMSPDEAVEFVLKRGQQTDRSAAAVLAGELGYLPLALEHAAAYIEKHGSTFAGYSKLFRERQKEILARAEPPVGYKATITTTWELSFGEVEKQSLAAAQLMNLCAFLASDDIGREMLQTGTDFLPEPLTKALKDDLLWDETLAALRRYSLVEVQGNALSVHRLVQAVAQDRLSCMEQNKWAEAAVNAVNCAIPPDSDDFRTWPQCARLLPHALSSADRAERLQVGLEVCSRLLTQVSNYLVGRGELSAVGAVLEQARRVAEAAYGSDHPNVARIDSNLGLALMELGDLAGAQTHFKRALEIDEVVYGPDHESIATDANNLGSALQQQGDLAGARTHFERALRIGEATCGPNHPNLAIPANNLGLVLWELGDLSGAWGQLAKALMIDELAYGPAHPEVATDVNNLGSVLQYEGDVAGARACFERALRIREEKLGGDHPKTQAVRRNLRKLGR